MGIDAVDKPLGIHEHIDAILSDQACRAALLLAVRRGKSTQAWNSFGLKFLEAAHIKDVLAFLRWAENLLDRISGFRTIQLLPGAGPATAARLLDRLAETSSAMEALTDFRPPATAQRIGLHSPKL